MSLHRYETDPALPQKDGVNLAHENISALLGRRSGLPLDVHFHDFNRLLSDEEYARKSLAGVDVVVSNVGPHAHFYFWLRETLGLNFRIVRDVRTAIWSSYLLQEHLCQPYLRASDALIFASNYCWGIYERVFPSLARFPAMLCYPLSVGFPDSRPADRNGARAEGASITLGYLGRLSDDKNFHDILDVLVALNRNPARRHSYKLLACGDIHSPAYAPDAVRSYLQSQLGSGAANCFEYASARPNREIWGVLSRFDMMLFPSTSNLETFGRVLIEASFCRLPVIAGFHAAAPELVDPAGLCSVIYDRQTRFDAHFDHCLGRVDQAQMQAAILSGKVRASASFDRYSDHPDRFVDLLLNGASALASPVLTQEQSRFVDGLAVDMPPALDISAANRQVAILRDWFLGLQRQISTDWAERTEALTKLTRHPRRTRRFMERATASRGDFTDVGGVDIELCNIAGFHPRFRVDQQRADPVPAARIAGPAHIAGNGR